MISIVTAQPRSGFWPEVQRAFLLLNPVCAGCGLRRPALLEAHHRFPFHECVLAGRPDLELDPRNLYCLCMSTKLVAANDCHLVKGHYNDFRSWNPNLAEDLVTFYGMTATVTKADPRWIAAHLVKPLDWPDQAPQQRMVFRQMLDTVLPPDPAILMKYRLSIGSYPT